MFALKNLNKELEKIASVSLVFINTREGGIVQNIDAKKFCHIKKLRQIYFLFYVQIHFKSVLRSSKIKFIGSIKGDQV